MTIRNCEIFYVSGDCIQFDPDRKSTGKLLIEHCTLWTGPLPADAAGFRQGERPGAATVANCAVFDSKTGVRMEDGLRDLTIRSLAFGPGVQRKYQMVGGPFPGYDNQGEIEAGSIDVLLQNGWR